MTYFIAFISGVALMVGAHFLLLFRIGEFGTEGITYLSFVTFGGASLWKMLQSWGAAEESIAIKKNLYLRLLISVGLIIGGEVLFRVMAINPETEDAFFPLGSTYVQLLGGSAAIFYCFLYLRKQAICRTGVTTDPVDPLIQATPPPLNELFRSLKNPDYRVRLLAIEKLAQVGDSAVNPFLADALKDAHAEVRRAAIDAAGKRRIKEGFDGLIAALNDFEPANRFKAIEALALLGDPKGEAKLQGIAADKSDEDLSKAASRALKSLRPSDSDPGD